MKNNVKTLPLVSYSDTKMIEDEFPSIESRDSIFSNIAEKMMIYTTFLLLFCLFCPFLFVLKRYDLGLLMTILFVIIGVRIRKYKNPIPNYKMIVNKEGAEYYNEENELLDKVLYTDLLSPIMSPKPKYDIESVFYSYRYKGRITNNITVWIKSEEKYQEKREIYFHPVAVFFNLQVLNHAKQKSGAMFWKYIKNERELQKHFIKVIQVFRPDLKINSLLLKMFGLSSH
ncbi:hypothetical protein [Chryseobacterium sp. SIMBA_028]|uniref:hypothetical protein n=2 Tax=Bacteria TaxID=2 RepID=UPI00397CBBDA